MTDPINLPVPEGLRRYAASADRERDVLGQSIAVDPSWWSTRVPDSSPAGDIGRTDLERRDLFALAESARQSPEGVLDLLWASLSWGTGTRQRNNARRLASLRSNPSLTEGLQHAVGVAGDNPRAAYLAMRPQRNLVPYLGPPFFTKFLYFAAGDIAGAGSLILDSRVADSLRANGWDDLSGKYWWLADTYEAYLELARRWASELTQADGAPLAPDQVELWLFRGSDGDPAGEDAADEL